LGTVGSAPRAVFIENKKIIPKNTFSALSTDMLFISEKENAS
jgi:hypothetical protein